MLRLWLLWTQTCSFKKTIPMLGKETTDYSATALIKFIEGFFHKRDRLRCDGEPSDGSSRKQSEAHCGGLGET